MKAPRPINQATTSERCPEGLRADDVAGGTRTTGIGQRAGEGVRHGIGSSPTRRARTGRSVRSRVHGGSQRLGRRLAVLPAWGRAAGAGRMGAPGRPTERGPGEQPGRCRKIARRGCPGRRLARGGTGWGGEGSVAGAVGVALGRGPGVARRSPVGLGAARRGASARGRGRAARAVARAAVGVGAGVGVDGLRASSGGRARGVASRAGERWDGRHDGKDGTA